MSLMLTNLDESTRQLMVAEYDLDIANNALYFSNRLTDTGRQTYPALLKEAIHGGDDNSLAQNIRSAGIIKAQEERRSQTKGIIFAKVPANAPEMLAEGEFNRFYCRGVCARAIKDGITDVVVYRAKHTEHPRPESETKIGQRINAAALLNDLRTHQGVDTAFGLPAGPNSGLSVRLP